MYLAWAYLVQLLAWRSHFEGFYSSAVYLLCPFPCLSVGYVELLHFLSSVSSYWHLPYWLNASHAVDAAFPIQLSSFLGLSRTCLAVILTKAEEVYFN